MFGQQATKSGRAVSLQQDWSLQAGSAVSHTRPTPPPSPPHTPQHPFLLASLTALNALLSHGSQSFLLPTESPRAATPLCPFYPSLPCAVLCFGLWRTVLLKYHLLSGVAAVRDKCGQGRAGEMVKALDQLNKQPEFGPWQSQNWKRELTPTILSSDFHIRKIIPGWEHANK